MVIEIIWERSVTAMSFCILSRQQLLIANPSFGGEPALFWNFLRLRLDRPNSAIRAPCQSHQYIYHENSMFLYMADVLLWVHLKIPLLQNK